ncbi:MAG: DUF1598 domain-containing protein [Thermoguttaceae bacterium]
MVTNRRAWIPASFPAGVIAVVAASVLAFASSAWAQAIVEAVGGISINADGVLKNATLDGLGNLNQFWAKNLQKVPDGLGPMAGMRKVSLRNLEAAVEESVKTGKPLAQDIKFLGGLQAIRYVLVYPEQHDIVLVGPGEGWRVDTRGNLVGVTTGRPVMWLEDLLVALRSAKQAAQGGITCSIDPDAQRASQLRNETKNLRAGVDPQAVASSAEQTLGTEAIRFHGVPATSHFARILVAADYHMKRLAMNFDPSPVRGLPSYLQMLPPGGRAGTGNMMQRWWLEPKYESVLRDAEGLSWEFRGGSVQAMTEEDFLTANGAREHTGKANRLAQRWADNMTKKYNALAVAEPIFGQLQNCMELAIVGALIVKENLPAKTGNSLPALMDEKSFKTEEYRAPKEVDSKASILGRHIAVSGGVSIQSWLIVDRAQKSDAPTAVRAKATPAGPAWCWN